MLLKVEDTIIVTQEHPYFADTEYSGYEFQIVVRNLTRSEKVDLINSIQELEDKEAGWIVFTALFHSSTITIDNVKGKTIKSTTEEYQRLLYEYFPDVADVVACVGL